MSRTARIAVVFGRPPGRGSKGMTHTYAAWWMREPTADPWTPPDAIGGGYSADDARERVLHIARCFAGENAEVLELDAKWARAARYAAKDEPPWPEQRKARKEADDAYWEDFKRRVDEKVRTDGEHRTVDIAPAAGLVSSLDVLGLEAAATPADVKRAYRRLVATERCHPDQGGDVARFRALTEAKDSALWHLDGRCNQ